MLRKVLGLLFLFGLMAGLAGGLSAKVHATETALFAFSVEKASYEEGELVKLEVDAAQLQEDVAGFCIAVGYDDTRLSFVRVEASSQIKSKTLQTDGTGNPVRSTYVCNVDLGHAPALTGTVLTYVFAVKEGASEGETALEAAADQVCNWSGEQVDRDCAASVSVEVLPPKSGKASMQSLTPSSGKLSPAFSPDIYNYTLNVSHRVSSVEFQTQAAENGTVSVSRKTLQKAGSTTAITVTVTSESRKQKAQYVIDVNREEAPEETEWEAYLADLSPSIGTLQPTFSPDVTEYTLDVGAEVQTVGFRAEAGEDGSVSISREKLNRAGTSTEIKITAVSADRKNRQVYTVTVNRSEESSVSQIQQEVFLTALQPSVGVLEPPFSPEVLGYTLQVGAEVRSVVFQADAVEGATVSVNRKTLYSAGSTTEIVATVRSSDQEATKQYVVSVIRAEEEAAAKVGAAPKRTSSSVDRGRTGVTNTSPADTDSQEEGYIPLNVGEPSVQETEFSPQSGAMENEEAIGDSTHSLVRENNQMFVFLVGMGAAIVCILLGAAIVLLLEKEKNKKS